MNYLDSIITPPTRVEQLKRIEAEASTKAEAERDIRAFEIYEIGKKAHLDHHLVVNAISDETVSVEDFTNTALEHVKKLVDDGRKSQVTDRFSLRQFILDRANGNSNTGAEREVIDAESSKEMYSKQLVRGAFLPQSVFQPKSAKRLLTAGTNTAGGFTVDEQLAALVEPLNPNLPISSLVTKQYTAKPFTAPVHETAATAEWTGETIAPTESTITFGEVKQSAKTILGFTTFSKELLVQSSLDIENLVRRDLSDVISFSIEKALLKATGTGGQPTGLENNANLTTITRSSADSITYDECLQAEEALGLANVMTMNRNQLKSGENNVARNQMLRRFSLNWIISPKFRRLCKKAEQLSGGSLSLWDDGNSGNSEITVHGSGSKRVPKILDYDAHISTFASQNLGILGNFADIVLTYFTSIDIVVDPLSLAESNLIKVVVSQMCDFYLRHNDSVVKISA